MTAPLSRRASSTARADLPLAVGPKTTISRGRRLLLCTDALRNFAGEFAEPERPVLFTAAFPDRDGFARNLLFAHHHYVGNFLHFSFAYPFAQRFAGAKKADPNAFFLQRFDHPFCVSRLSLAYASNRHLDGREPERQLPAAMLQEHADKPFERAEDGPMNDPRQFFRAVLGDIVRFKLLRQHDEVQLGRAHLPVAVLGIF